VGWLAVGAWATNAVDAEVERFRDRAGEAFAGTDLAHVRSLEYKATIGTAEDDRRLAEFLARPGRLPFAFHVERGDYVADYRVESWATERTVEVEWTEDGVAVTTHP
jgi:hypothetical protein